MSDIEESGAAAIGQPSEPTAAWIDEWLCYLRANMTLDHSRDWTMLEPTSQLYAKLETGDDSDLQSAVLEIGRHIGLGFMPHAEYELGLRMSPQAAGEIQFSAGRQSLIRIPLFYVGKPHELGAILAHEVTHQLLALLEVTVSSEVEYERLTDLASFAVGLGKLVLNGTVHETAPGTGETRMLGYLPPWAKAYAYRSVNKLYAIPDHEAVSNLTHIARSILAVTPPDQ